MPQRGFTLLELLVYVAIVAIVVVVLSSAVISFTRAKSRAEAITETDEALRFVSERITRDVEHARAITLPTVTATSSSLSLTRGTTTVTYAITGTALTRTFGTTTEVLTNDRVAISSVDFTRTSNYEPLRAATSTGVRWTLRARHAFIAPEYAYDAERKGAAEIRNQITP